MQESRDTLAQAVPVMILNHTSKRRYIYLQETEGPEKRREDQPGSSDRGTVTVRAAAPATITCIQATQTAT